LNSVAKRIVENIVYRRAAIVVVLSGAFKQVLVERYKIQPRQIQVIPPGVDLTFFNLGPKGAARAKLGLPTTTLVVLAVRRLTPRMGIDVLLQAWRRTTVEPRVLLLVGSGPDRSRLEAIAVGLGLEASVRFLGRVSDDTLVDLYRAADTTVLPSVAWEGFGLSALESLACGTPALVSDVGGLPDAVGDLDRSLIVPAGDVDALAAGIEAAYAGKLPDAHACRRHAEKFSWEAVAQRHMALYTAVWQTAKATAGGRSQLP
jgi:glycosyltransferase involved in cell wall biosynthesis